MSAPTKTGVSTDPRPRRYRVRCGAAPDSFHGLLQVLTYGRWEVRDPWGWIVLRCHDWRDALQVANHLASEPHAPSPYLQYPEPRSGGARP